VNLKKYFYVVRPALALRWLRLHPDVPPPMNLQEMVARLDLEARFLGVLEDLLARKAQARELGEAARIPEVDDLIRSEMDLAREAAPDSAKADHTAEAEALFRRFANEAIR
ncbi:MAG: nucleotidyltransferase domain-containing protein, partial [Pseudomonadota bacterium]